MGTFSVDLWIGNPFTEVGATVSALVDTGATNLMIPSSLLDELGIEPVETRFARVAGGRLGNDWWNGGDVVIGDAYRRRIDGWR